MPQSGGGGDGMEEKCSHSIYVPLRLFNYDLFFLIPFIWRKAILLSCGIKQSKVQSNTKQTDKCKCVWERNKGTEG